MKKESVNKDLILALIKAELRSNKLITGLKEAGLGVEDFYPDLGTVILTMIGFKERTDALYDQYDEMIEALLETEVYEFHKRTSDLAEEFYQALVQLKSAGYLK